MQDLEAQDNLLLCPIAECRRWFHNQSGLTQHMRHAHQSRCFSSGQLHDETANQVLHASDVSDEDSDDADVSD